MCSPHNRSILYSVDCTKMKKVHPQWHCLNSSRYCNLQADWLVVIVSCAIVHCSNGRLCLQWVYRSEVAVADCGKCCRILDFVSLCNYNYTGLFD